MGYSKVRENIMQVTHDETFYLAKVSTKCIEESCTKERLVL